MRVEPLVPFVTGVDLFSLFADLGMDMFKVAFASNESTAAMPSLRCFPKRNMCPMPRKMPGFFARLFLPSFRELWNGP